MKLHYASCSTVVFPHSFDRPNHWQVNAQFRDWRNRQANSQQNTQICNEIKSKRTETDLHGRTEALAMQKAGMFEFELVSIPNRCEDREITARLYGRKGCHSIYTAGYRYALQSEHG
jgi:hypothetical protein